MLAKIRRVRNELRSVFAVHKLVSCSSRRERKAM